MRNIKTSIKSGIKNRSVRDFASLYRTFLCITKILLNTANIPLYYSKRRILTKKQTISVQELSIPLEISLPKAYALVKTEGFPAIHTKGYFFLDIDGRSVNDYVI